MAKASFDHQKIEPEVQAEWASSDLYTSDLTDVSKDPYYLLVEFPYPSGDLHTGHWYAYAMPDIYARYLRMKGKNVLFPFGFDAFGLPAENAAIKRGLDPKKWTYENMDTMRTQVKRMGTSFDWSKEVITCEPEYYKWTQWLFSKLYEQKLAERREAAVKYCPKDQTVLANEQVINGHCERCGTEVVEKILTQWFLKITNYAKRLLADLEPLPWRQEIKEAQKAWIGESEGARITFELQDIVLESLGAAVDIFTTRPDTLFGVTYLVLAPEHPLVEVLRPATQNASDIESYIVATTRKTERERSENKEKTGVQLKGISARNPASGESIPVFIADYVLASYGTGAVMAVPAHDERDFEFARKYELPIRQVIAPRFIQATEPGVYRSDEPIHEKDGVIAIIKHWKEDKYLALKWKNVAWGTFLTGGIDEGYTPEETVIKEIREETGYTRAHIIRKLGMVEGLFYHVPKERNQLVRGHVYYVELAGGAHEAVSVEETAKHEIVWLTKEELAAFLTPDTHQYSLSLLVNEEKAYTEPGYLVDSGAFTGRSSEEVLRDIVEAVGGELITQYRMRDWLISRQRYWGCPIPVVYDPEGTPHLIPTEQLPWLLPTDVDFTPTGKSPLATSKELHERVEKIFGAGWTPEYDTLDVFVDSAWYYARYLDPHNEESFADPALMKKWLSVNRYTGGAEHTTVHLLYARFFYKALYDLALVPSPEPFIERFNRGIILGPDNQKMSKSKGNVINPDELVEKYGADSVRMYLAFIGPYNEPGNYPWNLDGVEAMRRFLDRLYRLASKVVDTDNSQSDTSTIALLVAKTADKVGSDAERFKFNTAISALMILVRELEGEATVSREHYGKLLRMLAPFAPHLAEHLWKTTIPGEDGSVHQTLWPEGAGEDTEELTTVIIQVNSKRRGEMRISPTMSEDEAFQTAWEIPAISNILEQGPVKRRIYVPGRILNLIIELG